MGACAQPPGPGMSARSREFELAVKTFTPDLYRFAFWLARDRHAAEDLVQECFQRAWTRWECLNDSVTLKKWLFTILRREFLRRLERKQFDTVELDGLELAVADTLGMDEIYSLRSRGAISNITAIPSVTTTCNFCTATSSALPSWTWRRAAST